MRARRLLIAFGLSVTILVPASLVAAQTLDKVGDGGPSAP